MKNLSNDWQNDWQLFLILSFSFWFLFSLGYLCFSSLDDLDVTSALPCLKSLDPEDSVFCPEKKEQIQGLLFEPSPICGKPLFTAREHTSFYQSVISLTPLILRC